MIYLEKGKNTGNLMKHIYQTKKVYGNWSKISRVKRGQSREKKCQPLLIFVNAIKRNKITYVNIFITPV